MKETFSTSLHRTRNASQKMLKLPIALLLLPFDPERKPHSFSAPSCTNGEELSMVSFLFALFPSFLPSHHRRFHPSDGTKHPALSSTRRTLLDQKDSE